MRRKSTNLSKVGAAVFLATSVGILVTRRLIFVQKGEVLENVLYKSDEIIIQKLQQGDASNKILIVLGNGWNVSVDEENKVTEHDPFFLLPTGEVKLLSGKGYEIITAYFPFECSGIEQPGRELASFINTYYQGYKVFLIGHSKSGVCFANLSKWLNVDGKDANIITAAAPFDGVKSDDENLSKLNNFEKVIYPIIIVPHRTNDDITMNSEFLNDVADFSGLETRNFYCVRTLLQKPSDPIAFLLKWVDTKLEIGGDGMVGLLEQKPPVEPTKEFIIDASHQSSMQKAIKLLISEGIL